MDVASLVIGLLAGLAAGLVAGLAVGRSRQAVAQARADAARDKAEYVETQLAERFRALSAQALDATNQRFLDLAEGRLRAADVRATGEMDRRQEAVEHIVAPLKDTLSRVETQLREFESGRRAAHAELAQQVEFVRRSNDQLRTETQSLVTALRRPEARGRWGELQLRRVVELAGMARYCDFEEQVSVATADGAQRPDMVVRLAGGRSVVVDSKVSLAAYLEAAQAGDESVRNARMDAHARHVRQHVDRLAAKSYWAAFSPSPEFVVLFIPGEAFLAPALDHDPQLLEYAMAKRVHIATPTTLVSMLRTASYAWQQQALGDNARAVFDLGRELYDRLATMGRHVDALGKALTRTVATYNQTVGSLESRVMASARRLADLDVVSEELPSPEPVEEAARSLSAPELVESADRARALRAVEVTGAADGEEGTANGR
jgi:DNA recombination protein RmuC